MEVKIKLLASMEIDGVKLEEGTIMKVDKETAEEFIKKGLAEDTSEDDAKEKQAAAAKELVLAVVKELTGEGEGEGKTKAHIQTRVKGGEQKEDPTGGYLDYKKEYSKGALEFGFGQFLKDAHNAAGDGNSTPKRLIKCQQIAEDQIRKAAGDGQSVGVDPDGGFTVPRAFSDMMLTTSLEMAVIRPKAMIIPMGTNVIDLPIVSDFDHSNDLVFGGVASFFLSEEGQYTSSKMKFENVELKLKKLTALGFVTEEMLRWSPVSVGGFLMPAFAQALAWKEDQKFIGGSGVGEPLGLINGGSFIAVAKESSQSAAGVVWLNVANQMARLRSPNRSRQFFFGNQDLIPFLTTMTVGDQPVWLMANSAANALHDTLAGRPLLYTEHAKAVGTPGDLVLCDGSQYLIGDDQNGPDLAQSIHLKFDFGQTAFKITKFVDGQPMHRKVFTPSNGSTKSAFVGIATRP